MDARVAVVGSGPSGMYATEALLDAGVSVDVLEALPIPFGLVRYGVAPDHFSIRSVRNTLDKTLARDGVRFLGNVNVGTDVTLAELHEYYDAVVFTYGASSDRRLGIPGEDLEGSVAATELVAWYCGHPDAHVAKYEALLGRARSVAVIGVGNVAVDVVRVLAKNAAELEATDMPQPVLDVLASTSITDVYLIGRRGPAQGAFTTKELRELGELEDAEVIVEPGSGVDEAAAFAATSGSKVAARNVEVITEWSTRTPRGAKRRIHVMFLAKPVELVGTDAVERMVLERTELDADGNVSGTGEHVTIDADLVVRSVGYKGRGLDNLPFDDAAGVVRNVDGRIVDESGAVVPGGYVAGWIRRGPSGIIGTNKKCGIGAVNALLEDLPSLPRAPKRTTDEIDALLVSRGVQVVTKNGWRKIDEAEIALGATRGRERTTLHHRDELLAIAK